VSSDRLGIRCVEVLGSATRELINERPVFGTISCFPCLLNHNVNGFFQSREIFGRQCLWKEKLTNELSVKKNEQVNDAKTKVHDAYAPNNILKITLSLKATLSISSHLFLIFKEDSP
jgi:hypothetical protein